MIGFLLRRAALLDSWLRKTLGKPYGVLLTIGLALEIAHRVGEMRERAGSARGLAPLILFMLLNLALLIHQLGELSERRRPEAQTAADDTGA